MYCFEDIPGNRLVREIIKVHAGRLIAKLIMNQASLHLPLTSIFNIEKYEMVEKFFFLLL